MVREALEIRAKNNKFRALLINNALRCKVYHKSAQFSIPHTDAHDRLYDISLHSKPHFPQITSVFKPSHNMVRSTEERFAMERVATRGFGAKKIAITLGLPQSTTKRWLQRLRSDGDLASRNIGRPRGAEAGVCRVLCMFRLTPLGVMCASRLWVHGCNEDRVRAAALINAWISVEPIWENSWYSLSSFFRNKLKGGVRPLGFRVKGSWSGARRYCSALAKRRGCGEHLARHARHVHSVVIVLLVPSRTPNCLLYSVSCGSSQ